MTTKWPLQPWKTEQIKFAINPGNIGGRTENSGSRLDTAKERNIPIRVGVNSGSLEKELVENITV